MSTKVAHRIMWAAVAITGSIGLEIAYAQQAVSNTGQSGGAGLATMPATALLGVAFMGTLGLFGVVVRYMVGKWQQTIEANTLALQSVRDVIERCKR